jgi:hypothetical protein
MKKKTLFIRISQIQHLLFGFPGFPGFWVDNPNKGSFLFRFPGFLSGFRLDPSKCIHLANSNAKN